MSSSITPTYSLSLHDALPIYQLHHLKPRVSDAGQPGLLATPVCMVPYTRRCARTGCAPPVCAVAAEPPRGPARLRRSEEHTSELQSRVDLVCRLLLEKKNSQR